MTNTKAAEGWSLNCTATTSAGYCQTRSPATKTARGMRAAAIRAGWRVWGNGDTGLIDGEALCPVHVTTKPSPGGEQVNCDKASKKSPCSGLVYLVTCDELDRRDRECGNKYGRCDAHGGAEGARRSLRSHKGVYHPATPEAK